MKLILMNPTTKKGKTMKRRTRKKSPIRRRRRATTVKVYSNPRRRRRVRGGITARRTRPVLYKARGRYYGNTLGSVRPGTRINPRRRRRSYRRSYRRNPAVLRGFTIQKLLRQLRPIAMGAIGGIGLNMIFNRFVPVTNPTTRNWLKLGTALMLPLMFRRGVLGEASKYGAVVLGASALKSLVQDFVPALPMDGYRTVTDEQELLGFNQLNYAQSPQDSFADEDYGTMGFNTLEYGM